MSDTLEVTEKISEVRGEVERLQGELNYMSHQVAISAIAIRLIQESDAQVAGLHWRPLYNAKLAAREMISGHADWLDFLVALIPSCRSSSSGSSRSSSSPRLRGR